MIDRSYIEQIVAHNDIVGLISDYVPLKRSGRGYVGICPFHNEKTPSFSVNPEHNYFHCFGCGAGGNVITFVMRYNNLLYADAIKMLATRVGMKLPDEDDEQSRRRALLLKINKDAARYFHNNLTTTEGLKAREYLQQRGLPSTMVTRFGIGYAHGSYSRLLHHMTSIGYKEADLDSVGLLRRGSRGYFDFFRNRIIFPIIDLQGHVIAFGGRLIDGEGPKYLNTSDTPIFNKGHNLFALNLAKKERDRSYLLCEGYMDVAALHGAGFKTAVATLGTALTSEQAKLISNYAERVVLCYDSDEAGQRATAKATSIFSNLPTEITVLQMDGAKDPDEYIKNYGREKFAQLIKNSNSTVAYALQNAKRGIALDTDDGRIRYVNNAVNILADMTSTVTEREIYAGRIEQECGVSKAAILAQLKGLLQGRRKRQEKAEFKDSFSPYTITSKKRSLSGKTLQLVNREQQLVAAILIDPSLISYIGDRLNGYEFCEPSLGEAYLIAKKYYDGGLSISFAVIASELSEESTKELTATMARFTDIVPSRRDIELYLDNIILLSGERQLQGEIELGELTNFIEKKKERIHSKEEGI